MFGWFGNKKTPTQTVCTSVTFSEAEIPDNVVVYAIGDIHGRADLLEGKLAKIRNDKVANLQQKTVVYLGDLVDRGLQSKQVIDLILAHQDSSLQQVWLMGNHEEFMFKFLDDPKNSLEWWGYGGAETLLSYNVQVTPGVFSGKKAVKAAQDLRSAMADAGHDSFLRGFRDSLEIGDYLFVHAGVDPERPFTEQGPETLRWIREPFLSHAAPLARVIVHGHTVVEEPVIRVNRVGIDTGAYSSGNLTCLRLENTSYRFL